MRIAMLSLHSSPLGALGTRSNGGMSVYISELVRSLGDLGLAVDVYTMMPLPGRVRSVRLHRNVRLIHLADGGGSPGSGLDLYRRLPRTWDALESFRAGEGIRYDLVHSHYWLSGVLGLWAQEGWGVPHLAMFHTLGAVKNAVAGSEQEPAVRVNWERELTGRCHGIVVPTERERRNLLQHCGGGKDRLRLIPCGVNLRRFRPVARAVARERLGLPATSAILLYVGRFAPVKGVDRLAAMVARLEDQRVRLLVIGGDGEESPAARALVADAHRMGVADRVSFLGPKEQAFLGLYYSAADALVMPSRYESFGLVALEALACGTPVVGTPVGVVEDLVTTAERGRVVEQASPASLATAAAAVLAQGPPAPEAVQRMRTAVSPYAWPKVAAATLREYQGLLRPDAAGVRAAADRGCLCA